VTRYLLLHCCDHLLPKLNLFYLAELRRMISVLLPILNFALFRPNDVYVGFNLREALTIGNACWQRNPARPEQSFSKLNQGIAPFS